jgi:hypothetical protein
MQHSMRMAARLLFAAGLIASTWAASPALASHRDQDDAYENARIGRIRPLPEIERRVSRDMGGASYLGPEYDAGSDRYRLKYMREGSVIWIDVDGRTGRVVGHTGR